ncbi:hypothetical protein AAFF_G00056930 [Aldrovandia affinis]|uniref:Uncharacterized protein n=1 Tax=Aldrovandia affinis TaxID=143900 RepID=A0AAD7WEE8_9TELE|nr:hypothetical protein AAFF_G00056930 [Aldrovandia affinis]
MVTGPRRPSKPTQTYRYAPLHALYAVACGREYSATQVLAGRWRGKRLGVKPSRPAFDPPTCCAESTKVSLRPADTQTHLCAPEHYIARDNCAQRSSVLQTQDRPARKHPPPDPAPSPDPPRPRKCDSIMESARP